MIVECESCRTRFRLDEARIPATGAKVRCSRCKTAFIVHRPKPQHEAFIEEVVAEATNPGEPLAPESTEDLFDSSGGSATLGGPSATERAESGSSDEEKWEFDEAPPANAARAPAARPASDAGSQTVRSSDSEELAALGSPEGWDLLSGARDSAADARFEAPAPPPVRSPVRARREPERASVVDDSLAAAASAPARRAVAAPEPTPFWLQTLRSAAQLGVDSGVWLASIALCTAGLALALTPAAEAPTVSARVLSASFRGEKVEVSRHAVENALGARLVVVRGRLPAGAVTTQPVRMRATWLDALGEPIAGASAVAGPPLDERKVRELSFERIRAEHDAHALELTAGGAFEAVFDALPDQAAGIALSQERVPVSALAVTQPEPVAEAPRATASSRPTARPSSE